MKPKLIQRGQYIVDINLRHCDSCFYFEPKSDIEYNDAKTFEEANSWDGRFRFLPSIIKVKRNNWCGQYKNFNVFFYQK